MKNISFLSVLLCFVININAQTILTPPNVIKPPVPGNVLTTPHLFTNPDLTIVCSGASIYHQPPIPSISDDRYYLRFTVTVRNNGELPSTKPIDLRGYVSVNPANHTSATTPRFQDFNDEGSSIGRVWKFIGCRKASVSGFTPTPPCMYSINDTIQSLTTITRNCEFDLGDVSRYGSGSTFFLTMLVDYSKRVFESLEDNNVSVPIRVSNTPVEP